MRVLLTSNASYVPPRGGSTRSNRVWMDYLAAHGHQCRVVSSAAPASTPQERERVRCEAASQGFSADLTSDDVELTLANGIHVTLHRDFARRSGVLAKQIAAFRPDWVLVSSEDLGHSLLREAEEAAPGRIVYIAHTPQFLPFGPESWSPDAHSASRVRNAAAVIVIGHHMARYVREHLGVEAHVIHPAIYGAGPFESYSNFELRNVLMVNPCAVKGLSIFAELARAMPDVRFTALPGWGTTSGDREALAAIPNVTTLGPVRRIEQVLEQTSLLVMPSLWYEGFGLIVMEAMLRGIPVVASDSGGLVEAKQGTGFVILVKAISEYLPEFDEVHMPRPVLPTQDLSPWLQSVRSLLNDRELYEDESGQSRDAAVDFVYGLKPSAIEDLLRSLRPGRAPKQVDLGERIEKLSPEQKALLLARLKARAHR